MHWSKIIGKSFFDILTNDAHLFLIRPGNLRTIILCENRIPLQKKLKASVNIRTLQKSAIRFLLNPELHLAYKMCHCRHH